MSSPTSSVAHPRQGPQDAGAGTPPRRRRSVRRTTTHTCSRPEGLAGNVMVEARGRDLLTRADGTAEVVAAATVEAAVAFARDRTLQSIAVDPPLASPDALLGVRVSSGFRRVLDEAVPDEDRSASLRYQLLDDLPTAVLVSGVAIAAMGYFPPPGRIDFSSRADICAGWATGATILTEAAVLGHPPVVAGPPAPPLLVPTDPAGWHELGAMPRHSTRRWRRIDVWTSEADGASAVSVEAFFRDSHVDGEGTETVVHEYLVTAELEPGTGVFRSCQAQIRVLPWVECPAAAASAERLAGTGAADLRERIRESFVGTSTCTHLNDTLRALAALPFLAGLL